ncbi:hypothetical protein DID88_000092 [Monilinia fructigena]|uniref:Cytochrome P450 n=1 Tax=Monilinia fructigena TaxID=38457 RepID=A0A395IJC9_9HELO|nr:hypothetical protein DID88_000092 [Monilinia fructigena]
MEHLPTTSSVGEGVDLDLDLHAHGLFFNKFTAFTFTTTVLVIVLIAWVVRFVRYRQSYREYAAGLPCPPFSIVLGTLKSMGEQYAHAPMTAHPHGIMTMIYNKYQLKDMFILDNWPFFRWRQIIICDPNLAAQCTQNHSLPKIRRGRTICWAYHGEEKSSPHGRSGMEEKPRVV